jgi:GNAT acetyltransferase-like protein
VASEHPLRSDWSIPATDALDIEFELAQDPTTVDPYGWWKGILSASSSYHLAEVVENGQTLGRIPYFVRRSRLGFKWGRNPDWSIPEALYTDPGLTPQQRAIVIEDLVKRLPRHLSLYLVFREDEAWSQKTIDTFARNGFEHSCVPTYQWRPSDDDVLGLMKSKARSQLRSAQKQLDVVEITPSDFVNYYGSNLVLKKERSPRPLSLAKDLLEAALHRGTVRITAARGSRGATTYDAAIACTWDNECYYYWMSSYRPNLSRITDGRAHKDAVKVLILDAMRHAKSLGLVFDTDGIGSGGSDHLYREILKLKKVDTRHAFRRATKLVACYEKYRPLLMRLTSRRGGPFFQDYGRTSLTEGPGRTSRTSTNVLSRSTGNLLSAISFALRTRGDD